MSLYAILVCCSYGEAMSDLKVESVKCLFTFAILAFIAGRPCFTNGIVKDKQRA